MRIIGDTSRLNKSRQPPVGGSSAVLTIRSLRRIRRSRLLGAGGAFVRLSPVDAPAVRAVPIVYIGGFVDIDVKLGAVVIVSSFWAWL